MREPIVEGLGFGTRRYEQVEVCLIGKVTPSTPGESQVTKGFDEYETDVYVCRLYESTERERV